MIQEIVIKSLVQEAIKSSTKFLKEKKLKLNSTFKDIETAIANHTNEVDNWSKEINFNDLKKSKLTTKVFIDVDISLLPRKYLVSSQEIVEKISSQALFSTINKNLVILGQPGAGKTTLTKFWCQSVLWDANFYPDLFKIPILIRLKEINEKIKRVDEKNILINLLFEQLGLVISKEDEEVAVEEDDILLSKERLLFPILQTLQPLIILEGFDEITFQKTRVSVLNDFKKLVLNLKDGIVVLTSRSSDYGYSIENTEVLEICSLDNEQVKKFALKWLGEQNKVNDFLKSLNDSPFNDTAIRPLTVSHLCAIYERVGKIPDKPKTVYRKIVNLLLEEWDEQRAIKRVSAYGEFEIDRKFEFLARLAYEIIAEYKSSSFSEQILENVFNKIKIDFSLEKEDSGKVIKEIESHTGLIIEAAYKYYEFAHKSLHEYLAAEHLVKLPLIPHEIELLSRIPNELAIAVTISSNSSLYFSELVFNRFNLKETPAKNQLFGNNFITTFVNRLVLEKPDFNASSETSLALVLLYTLFRTSDSSQLKLFEDDLPVQFEKFLDLIFKRNPKFRYQQYYSVDNEFFSESGTPILKLTRNEEKILSAKDDKQLPLYLYAKPSFLNS